MGTSNAGPAAQFELTAANAQTYRSKPNGPVKFAYKSEEPASFYKPTWGDESRQDFGLVIEGKTVAASVKGYDPDFQGYLLIVMPVKDSQPDQFGLHKMDVYGADEKTFLNEHVPVEGVPNGYRSAKKILAIKLSEPTEVVTRLKGGKYNEASVLAPAGHFLIQQPNGEQQVVEPGQFDLLYEELV